MLSHCSHNFSLPQFEYYAIFCYIFFECFPYFAHMSKPPLPVSALGIII